MDEVPVYEGIAHFNDWLKTDQGVTREELRETLIVEGKSEGDIESHFDDLETIFTDWCDQNGLLAQIV